MSEVSSRPRVRSVASRAVDADTLGAVAIGTLVATALRQLVGEVLASPPSVERVDRLVAGPEAAARLTELRCEATTRIAPGASLASAEKAAALLAISQAPLVVRPASVAAHLERLVQASTAKAVQQAEAALVRTIKSENSQAVGGALAAACREASIDAGFVHVETTTGVRGELRIVATDPVGRALVTEIQPGDDRRAPSIETEVVGVTDGHCHSLLDRFDAAMEAEGVRTDGPPERKWTGGVSEMSLARDFIRQKVAPSSRRSEVARTASKHPLRRRTVAQQG
jgi:hypothetical protein